MEKIIEKITLDKNYILLYNFQVEEILKRSKR